MRHPALTRFFAAILAVMCAITLLAGGLCVKKAGDDRDKQNTNTARLEEKTAEAGTLRAQLEAMPTAFEQQNSAYDAAKESYDSEKLSYRKDLALYTATEAGLKQAQEKLDEGYAALRMGWIEHDNGEKALDEAEAQYQTAYEQFLAGKAELEEKKELIRQAEELMEQLPDLDLLRTVINALKASKADIDASLDAIQAILDNPPIDPETGEVDELAQSAQLTAQLLILSGKLSAVQAVILAAYTPEQLQEALGPAAEQLSEQAEQLANGDLSAEELISAAQELLASGESFSAAFDEALAKADETVALLENLPELKAQLAAAEEQMNSAEPVLAETKATIDAAREKLDQAKDMLILLEANLISGTKELEEKQAEQKDTREDLERRKVSLVKETFRLDDMLKELEDYRELKDSFSNLRYGLLADEGISARVRAGEDLIGGAEEELAQRRLDTRREYGMRLGCALTMLAAAVCGAITVAAAFRERQGRKLLAPAALCFAFSAAAEGLSFLAGRGLLYSVPFAGLFALAILALNIKKPARS